MNKINDKKFGLQFIMNFIKFIFVLEVLCKVKIPYLKLKTELIKIIFMINSKYFTMVLYSYSQTPMKSPNLKTIFLKIAVIFKNANF